MSRKAPRKLRQDEKALWAEVRKRTTPLQGIVPRAMPFDQLLENYDGDSAEHPSALNTSNNTAHHMAVKMGKAENPAPKPDITNATTADLPQLWKNRQAPEEKPFHKTPNSPISSIEPRLRRRIVGGREEIGAKIDLHGLVQADAEPVLKAFLHRAFSRGYRTVLVITGKGRSSGSEGVLKKMVPFWLNQGDLRSIVNGWDEASTQHGGAGALYVRIKRPAPR